MKGLLVFLFFCIALASATTVKTKVASHEFVEKQQKILQLFYHIYQPNPYEDQVAIAQSYDIKKNIDNYNHSDVVETFLFNYHQAWMLPKGRTFSVMYGPLMNESVALFELFYYAKDFDTFYKTACWAREYLNEEMFIYSFSAALVHRPDCKDFFIPALYEIFPQYFFTTETIQKAYNIKMQGNGEFMGRHITENNKFWYIDSNYSSWHYNTNWEQRLNYFTEDISWNNCYYNYFLRFPYWMDGEKYGLEKENRGALFFFLHQQILARYYMERLSNGMGEIPEFSWEFPVEVGYDPYLKYPNGMNFPSRPNGFKVQQYPFFLTELQDYERRVRDAVARGFANKYDGTHVSLRTPESIGVLGNLIEANVDSPNVNYFGYTQFLARSLMGNSPRPPTWQKVTPSALEFYQTSLRDPMFYQLAKRYYSIFTKYQTYLHPYTDEDLHCPGVKVESVDIGRMVTFFESYDAEITNAVYQPLHEKINTDHLAIFARQHRLNHKPFAVTTHLESEKDTEVVFRFFLGPKYDGQHGIMTLDENRHNFFQLDQFVYTLKSGKNVVERSSEDFHMFDDDWTPTREVWKNIQHSIKDKKDYVIGNYAPLVSFPSRLALPKGARGGMPFYFYVVVTPHVKVPKVEGVEYPMIDQFNYGYPFDRPIRYEGYYNLTNMHFENVMIYHKLESEINQV